MQADKGEIRVLRKGLDLEHCAYRLKRGLKVRVVKLDDYLYRAHAVACPKFIAGTGFTRNAARLDLVTVLSAIVRTRSPRTPLAVRMFLRRHIEHREKEA